MRPVVPEYPLHRLTGRCGGTSTGGTRPAGVPTGHPGPRWQAVVGVLTGAYRLSKRRVQQVCADRFGVPLSSGPVCAVAAEVTAARVPAVAERRAFVQGPHAHVDETRGRPQGQRAWLWVVVTATATVFRLALSRSAAVLAELLDPAHGPVLTSARTSAYGRWPVPRRQGCWAHLPRAFQALVDRTNAGAALGTELRTLADAVLTWWSRVRAGTLRRATLRK